MQGGWENDETVEEAAAREAIEEAGVRGDLVVSHCFYGLFDTTVVPCVFVCVCVRFRPLQYINGIPFYSYMGYRLFMEKYVQEKLCGGSDPLSIF